MFGLVWLFLVFFVFCLFVFFLLFLFFEWVGRYSRPFAFTFVVMNLELCLFPAKYRTCVTKELFCNETGITRYAPIDARPNNIYSIRYIFVAKTIL